MSIDALTKATTAATNMLMKIKIEFGQVIESQLSQPAGSSVRIKGRKIQSLEQGLIASRMPWQIESHYPLNTLSRGVSMLVRSTSIRWMTSTSACIGTWLL